MPPTSLRPLRPHNANGTPFLHTTSPAGNFIFSESFLLGCMLPSDTQYLRAVLHEYTLLIEALGRDTITATIGRHLATR